MQSLTTYILFILSFLYVFDCFAQEKAMQPIIPIRFQEDYSFMRDRSGFNSFYDPLKFIPLNDSKTNYLSLGGEFRNIYESLRNRQDEGEGYLLTRIMFNADLHIGKCFRLFVQPASNFDFFREAPPRVIDRDELFLLNAFIDYDFIGNPGQSLIMRLGRQELNYGRGRMITLREGPNVRHYWEGLKFLYKSKTWDIDAFFTEYGTNKQGVFDNPIFDSEETFWGLYAEPKEKLYLNSKYNFYYLGFIDEVSQFFNASGEETRHSLGLRLYDTKGSFDYDMEGIGQFGSVGNSDIAAFGFYGEVGYTFDKEKALQKRFGLKVDYFTGDADAEDSKLNNFNPMYPRQGYYQGAGALYASNFWDIHPSLTFSAGKEFSFNFNFTWYWRTQSEDGVYIGGSGVPLIEPNENDDKFLGSQIDFNLVYRLNKYTSLNVDYSHFYAKGFIVENETPQEISDFLNIILTHRF